MGTGRSARGTAIGVGIAMVLALISPGAAARDADPWTGPDKAMHLAAGALLSGASYALWIERRDGRGWGLLLGAGVGLGAGAAKELADLGGMGRPSPKDFAWTALGTALGLGISLLVDVAVRGASIRRSPRAAPDRLP